MNAQGVNVADHELSALLDDISACRICRDTPDGGPDKALPHEPRPVCVTSLNAPVLIAGQAPGVRVHASGKPFTDPSGDRLRDWLGVDEARFYNPANFAIVPMGFCFPGLDSKGGDLNRPGFTGGFCVQMLRSFLIFVQAFIECLLCFLWRDITDGTVQPF